MSKKVAYELTIGEGEEAKVAKLKAIDRTIFKLAMNKAMSQDQFGAGEIILKSCLIEDQSDKEILQDDVYYCSAVMQSFGLLELKEGELKKV